MDEVVEEEDESVEERMDPGRVESEEVGAGDNAPACSNPPNMCADPRELVDVSWTSTALMQSCHLQASTRYIAMTKLIASSVHRPRRIKPRLSSASL